MKITIFKEIVKKRKAYERGMLTAEEFLTALRIAQKEIEAEKEREK